MVEGEEKNFTLQTGGKSMKGKTERIPFGIRKPRHEFSGKVTPLTGGKKRPGQKARVTRLKRKRGLLGKDGKKAELFTRERRMNHLYKPMLEGGRDKHIHL